ncbi:aprataxin and PNK-like factor [Schistocerca serialis cubense]|uniref:aprataxin and PNK-like factor n=1 Tax=Schistocerca serialis cubense TaxID=2023355 RepID=UPI00214E236A|nr:aprataxin and PNK-like factor [Schistocerca serialis cubense]
MSKITLVRLDGDAKHEVDIPVGETIIGRGPVMQCTDKRVSRTHAQIKVSEDGKIELTSTSLNPCYYNDEKVIMKSSSVELKIGDRFSFLPDSYCYCVKVSSPNGSPSEEGTSSSDNINNGANTEEKSFKVEETGVPSINEESLCTITVTPAADDPGGEMSVALAGVSSTADLSGELTDPDVLSDNTKNGPSDASPMSASKYVPKWLLAATERAKRRIEELSGEESGTEKVRGVAVAEEKSPAWDTDASVDRDSGVADTGAREDVAPTSAIHQMSDDGDSDGPATEKPSEEEPIQRQPSPRPVKDLERVSGGTEEKQQSGDGQGATSNYIRDPSPVQTSVRVPCKYGSACYRKNPQHFAEFSHPGDPDYKDDRPECRYGTECYTKNPLHRQTYKHTKKPPKKRQRVKKGAPKDADENSEEDEYDYDDPFLNDASSDDYEPTDSGSDVSASEGEEEQDLKRMEKEAKRFVRGKRKH